MEKSGMTNAKNHEKLKRLDSVIWKKRRIDRKGRVNIPAKLRRYLGLHMNSKILFIEIKPKISRDNEFLLEIGVER